MTGLADRTLTDRSPAGRARALAPLIRAQAEPMAALRRMPDELCAALRADGLYRLCIPKALGGLEAHPHVIIETLEALADTDASAAWCVMIGATTGVLGAYLAAEAASEIFTDPGLVLAGVYAPLGQAHLEGDRLKVTGRWRWASGAQNATWLCAGCVVHENGQPLMLDDRRPDQRLVLFPASQASFIDTWHTGGLRGTGSGDFSLTELSVPADRCVSLTTDRPVCDGPLYRFPVFGLLAMGVAAVACGNAMAAVREFSEEAGARRLPGGRLLAERGSVQMTFAGASARLKAARAFLISEVDACWREAEAGLPLSLERRAHLRLAATHLVRTAAEVVRELQDLAGGSGVFLASPLHRRLADAQTMTAHIMTAPASYELTGRALMGLPTAAAEL